MCAPLELDVAFIKDSADRSSEYYNVTTVGAVVDMNGVHFDGNGDYVAIKNFEYASDAAN